MISNNYFWLRQSPHIHSIATLGPEGSSSQAAANYLSSMIDRPLEIILFDTFELASKRVECDRSCALLVANAYERVDNFYMSSSTLLLGSFFYSPPDYYLICQDIVALRNKVSDKQTIRIETHHAPLSRLDELIKSAEEQVPGIASVKVELEMSDSTSKAAKRVAGKLSDCCLANTDAIELYGLCKLSSPLHIEMTWVLFSNNQLALEEVV